MNEYTFDPAEAFNRIKEQWLAWAKNVNANKFVLGISGGKDSTVTAALAAKIFGPSNVYGVMMPNGLQKDISDSMKVIGITGITSYAIDISNAVNALLDQLQYNGLKPDVETIVNLPPRVRMTTLYAVARTVGGFVLNTDNLDERLAGYFTIFGDGAGDYAPLRNLTVSEVIKLGDWLGMPNELTHKTPGDGLQTSSDEDRLGFKYVDMDAFIRENLGTDEFKQMIVERYNKNKFKTDEVNILGPKFDFPNYVITNS